jgi:hypothetical protein
MPMTAAEGAMTDRLARGESVPGGPGACARAGCRMTSEEQDWRERFERQSVA